VGALAAGGVPVVTNFHTFHAGTMSLVTGAAAASPVVVSRQGEAVVSIQRGLDVG
jgi:hypothetical protein